MQAPGDGVSGRLIARHAEQHEEGRQLVGREPLSVHLGVDEQRRQVLTVSTASGLRCLVHDRRQSCPGTQKCLQRVGIRRYVLGIPVAQNDVRVVEDLVIAVGSDAHHVADDRQRQARRNLRHEVARARGSHPVDDPGSGQLHAFLKGPHHPRRETRRDHLSQASMLGIVHGDHRTEELTELWWQIGDVGALS